MKYVIISIMLIAAVVSCKTSKDNCDAYSYAVEKDTLSITTEHVNYDTSCHESITVKSVIADTFYFHKN